MPNRKFLSLALTLLGCMRLASPSLADSNVKIPHGIFALGSLKNPVPQEVLQKPFVIGESIRIPWRAIEPGESVYDWKLLDNELKRVQSIGKTATVRIMSGSSIPDWLFAKIQTITVTDTNQYHAKHGQDMQIPVFWDAQLLAAKRRLYEAMGKRYANNPAIGVIGVAFANAHSDDFFIPTQEGARNLWKEAGYTPEKLIEAGKQTIDAAARAFPHTALLLAIGSDKLDGRHNQFDVEEDVIHYANQRYPGQLIVQVNRLAAFTPPPNEATGVWAVLAKYRPQVAGQMLWYVAGDSTYRMNKMQQDSEKNIMATALQRGKAYGMQYIEIYTNDLLESAFTPLFEQFPNQ